MGAPTATKRAGRQAGSKGPESSAGAEGSDPAVAELERAAEIAALGKAFRRVFASLRRLRGRDTHLGATELSHAQFELLIELYERGPLPAGELAAAARLTPATVTQMLDHPADCGDVERTRSDADRRVVVCALTPAGRRKIEAKRALWRSRWERALGDVDDADLRAATHVLTRLRDVFEDDAQDGDCVAAKSPKEL